MFEKSPHLWNTYPVKIHFNLFDLQTHKIKCDHSTGIIEMVMDRFTIENEGTYTVQLQDGKAKNQSSLVLIGDGKFPELFLLQLQCILCIQYLSNQLIFFSNLYLAFKDVLAEAEFQRKEFLRKQGKMGINFACSYLMEHCLRLQTCTL